MAGHLFTPQHDQLVAKYFGDIMFVAFLIVPGTICKFSFNYGEFCHFVAIGEGYDFWVLAQSSNQLYFVSKCVHDF